MRLKITRRLCALPNGPLLSAEGYHDNTDRLDELEQQLNLLYNLLQWNRKTGKDNDSPEEGWIACLHCKRKWRWKNRVNNLARTKCYPVGGVSAKRRITRKTPLSHLAIYQYFPDRVDPSTLDASGRLAMPCPGEVGLQSSTRDWVNLTGLRVEMLAAVVPAGRDL